MLGLYKKLTARILILALITLSLASQPAKAASCQELNTQLDASVQKTRAKQSGGWNAAKTPDADEVKTKALASQMKQMGCNYSSANSPKEMAPGQGSQIMSEGVPAAPGEFGIAQDPTFNPGFKLPDFNPGKLKPTDAKNEFKTPVFETPYKDALNETLNQCGELATDYAADLKKLSGADRPTFKAGCAGKGASGTTQVGPDAAEGTVCKNNEIGKFGLIQAAYNSDEQNVNVSSLLAKTPGNITAAETVAFKDAKTGTKNEAAGCRLSNYSSCGKSGDVILVQTKPNAASTDSFDAYLIYDGKGGFYEVTNSSQVIKSGPIDPTYNSASYAAIRMHCAVAKQ